MKKVLLLVCFCLLFLATFGQSSNLVLNKPIITSNLSNAANALDETTSTFASAPVSTGIKSLTVDIGNVYDITSMKLYFTTNFGKQYRISGSINNSTYHPITTASGSSNTWITCPISTSVKGIRYLKVEVNIDAQNYLVELREFQVFGIPSSISFNYDNAGNRTSRLINTEFTLTTKAQIQNALVNENDTALGDTNEDTTPDISFDKISNYQIVVFPNPTKGLLNVRIDNLYKEEKISIFLYDLSGKQIISYNQLPDFIDLSKQPDGEYLMNIFIGNEKSEWKIIKK